MRTHEPPLFAHNDRARDCDGRDVCRCCQSPIASSHPAASRLRARYMRRLEMVCQATWVPIALAAVGDGAPERPVRARSRRSFDRRRRTRCTIALSSRRIGSRRRCINGHQLSSSSSRHRRRRLVRPMVVRNQPVEPVVASVAAVASKRPHFEWREMPKR
ncbi:hypothetical protein BC831DRAFT_442962 [Entophlyctis helioformis]|nr:hypothetical protein BC831DRAFT_442962 [Entophlyctis helioformis]